MSIVFLCNKMHPEFYFLHKNNINDPTKHLCIVVLATLLFNLGLYFHQFSVFEYISVGIFYYILCKFSIMIFTNEFSQTLFL